MYLIRLYHLCFQNIFIFFLKVKIDYFQIFVLTIGFNLHDKEFILTMDLQIQQHQHLNFKHFQIIIHVFNLNVYIFLYIYRYFLLTTNQIQQLHLKYYFSYQKQMDIVIQIPINFYFQQEYLNQNKLSILQFIFHFLLLYQPILLSILKLFHQYHNLYLLIKHF